MQPAQTVVVVQSAPAAAPEPEHNCCGCIEVKCGLTTLMVFEVFYLIGFVVIVVMAMMAAALVKGAAAVGDGMNKAAASGTLKINGRSGSVDTNSAVYKNSEKSVDEVDTVGNYIMYVTIALIVAEIPRMYYLCKLCGFCCCGGKVRDTVADRKGIVMAIKALVVNLILSALLIIIIVAATGGSFSGPIVQILVQFIIYALFACWWIMDLNKWVASKENQA
tara:strand:+ start:148 stop:810 length:663 start_codon:yes stop_codon:yes gene_type:complete